MIEERPWHLIAINCQMRKVAASLFSATQLCALLLELEAVSALDIATTIRFPLLFLKEVCLFLGYKS